MFWIFWFNFYWIFLLRQSSLVIDGNPFWSAAEEENIAKTLSCNIESSCKALTWKHSNIQILNHHFDSDSDLFVNSFNRISKFKVVALVGWLLRLGRPVKCSSTINLCPLFNSIRVAIRFRILTFFCLEPFTLSSHNTLFVLTVCYYIKNFTSIHFFHCARQVLSGAYSVFYILFFILTLFFW